LSNARGHSIYHYATRVDYEPVIADIAAQLEVKYTVEEWLIKPEFRVYQSPLGAPDFGFSKTPFYAGLTNFLILAKDAPLPFGHMPERQVPQKHGLFPSIMPRDYRWIFFRASGLNESEQWGEGLLEGWLSTNSTHPDSLAIFNAFKKTIKKRFEYFKYSGVYVGSEAAKYFESGGRLTQDLRQPIEGDAKR
jgi:hypothetical protein